MVNDHVAYTNKLTSLLDQSFPGYAGIFSRVSCLSSLGLLAKYPTPEAILAAPKDELIDLVGKLARHGKIFGIKKVEPLIRAAGNAVKLGIYRSSMAILIRSTVSMIQTIQVGINNLETEIMRIAQGSPAVWHNVELLITIPGLAMYSAIVFLAEIGDIAAFSRPKQLVAFFGLDPSVRQSGTLKGTQNKMSKRGSHYLRALLNIITHVAVHPGRSGKIANPVLSAFYNKKCESKAPKVALCAAMHKMIYIIYAVLRDQRPFELRSPEEHVRRMHDTCCKAIEA
jgi:hypothetical protein